MTQVNRRLIGFVTAAVGIVVMVRTMPAVGFDDPPDDGASERAGRDLADMRDTFGDFCEVAGEAGATYVSEPYVGPAGASAVGAVGGRACRAGCERFFDQTVRNARDPYPSHDHEPIDRR